MTNKARTDEQVELSDESSIQGSPLFNHDLAPVPLAKRTWTTHHYAALWAGMACNIPTYMMSSALIASGMSWWQALITIFLGNTIVLFPILLNSHAGTKYGIPFPVLARASYGVIGSNVPALMRAVIACGWFGINAWIGGEAFYTLIKALVPSWPTLLGSPMNGYPPTKWLCFLLFWAANILVVFRGMEALKKLECFAAPFVFATTAALAAWAVTQAHGFGALVSDNGKFPDLNSFLPVFIPSVTAMIGSWSTLALNMPDFTRFGQGQRQQMIGQVVALPTSMTAFSGMGVIITSAGMVLYPHMKLNELWDPVTLIGQFPNAALVAAAMFTVMMATLSVNIAANVVSPANDFANCFPKFISFKRGAILTGLIGIVMQPWQLMADPQAYIFKWLLGYSGGLGSIAGVMIIDYWVIRRQQLSLPDLYLIDGQYSYTKGWHWRAVGATAMGCGAAWIGLVLPNLKFLYDYGWFVGFGTAALLYWLLSRKQAPARVQA